MEWLIIFGITLIVLVLCYFLGKKDEHQEVPECEPKEPVVLPLFEPNENGTVTNLQGLEKYGYGDLSIDAPVVNPYAFFFFIVRYRSIKNTIRFSIAVSRGFEEPRIIKNCTYDEYEDITPEKINKFVNKFDMFVDDAQFNKLVCKFRPDCIIEIIKKL